MTPTTDFARLLRITLRVDAAASGVSGAGLLALPGLHEDLFGFPAALALPTGLFLLLFAVALWVTAARRTINPRAVAAIIALNGLWVAGSVVVIVTGLPPLTTLGIGYVALQAVAVAVFAELEFVGLRRVAALHAVSV